MHEDLKKRVERLEEEKAPPITPEGQAIIDLLNEYKGLWEHPENYPPEDPAETERWLKEYLASDEVKAISKEKMEAQRNR